MKLILTAFMACISIAVQAQTIIPINITPEGHILLKSTINGVEGSFIFDTGGGLDVITKKFADKLKSLRPQDGGYTGFRATGERIDVELYTITGRPLDSASVQSSTIAVLDADFGPIDGLISMIHFQDRPFTIDYNKKQLILETAGSLAARKKNASAVIPLQLEDGRGISLDIFAYFVLNDQLTLQLLLDSGAGNNVFRFNSRYMAKLGVDKNDTSTVETIRRRSEIDTSFSSATYKTSLQKLSSKNAPGVKTERFKASFVDGLIYDGIVSINWIGKNITIDLQQKEMIVR